jgi:ATP-dependent exoDNAse (exonuclease V) beta subunit
VTDKAAYADSGVHWRRAEARHVALRVKELVDSGVASAGEIVLLFAAGTDAEWYEEELREAGLATYRATGRGYFGQQQVVDLLSYLRLLQNRYDDEALVSVLASPFVGVSNDALLLIRRAARGPIFTGLERSLPADLDERDVRLLRAFRQRYDRLVEAAARLSLERLCERIVADHDYDLAVLAQWDGRRRYANLRKLGRIARSFEELRGPDVEGFVRFVEEQEAVGAAERDAVAEEEGADAVRLLTIHAAKGLEFKVVVVADAGRDRNAPSADEILCLSDGRFGFRVADPVTGKRHGVLGYENVKDARQAEDEAERLRLYYVAMTRAVDRLIVSGSIDSQRKADEKTPIGWVLGRLDCAAEVAAAGRRRRSRRVSSCPSRPSSTTRRASLRSSHPATRRRCRRSRPCWRRSRRCPSRLCTTCVGSPTAHSRSSSAARTATTPSGSRACVLRGRTGPWPGRAGWSRPRSATRCTGCSSSSTWGRRRRRTWSRCAAGIRP